MEFEYDLKKSEANLAKHGIRFSEAEMLWEDPQRIELSANSEVESRHALVASISGKIWFAVYTIRELRIRIISVRRARKQEVQYYEN